jgi:protein gp37
VPGGPLAVLPQNKFLIPLRKTTIFFCDTFAQGTLMARKSKIEWTESTWNPVTGCTKMSAGCRNCYAERMALHLRAAGSRNYANGFRVTLHPHMLKTPLRWKRPRTIFVNSMSDLFHKDVPSDFISLVFDVMCEASDHRFQALTKRSGRLPQLSSRLRWPKNAWMGVRPTTCHSLLFNLCGFMICGWPME